MKKKPSPYLNICVQITEHDTIEEIGKVLADHSKLSNYKNKRENLKKEIEEVKTQLNLDNLLSVTSYWMYFIDPNECEGELWYYGTAEKGERPEVDPTTSFFDSIAQLKFFMGIKK